VLSAEVSVQPRRLFTLPVFLHIYSVLKRVYERI